MQLKVHKLYCNIDTISNSKKMLISQPINIPKSTK